MVSFWLSLDAWLYGQVCDLEQYVIIATINGAAFNEWSGNKELLYNNVHTYQEDAAVSN